MKLDLKLKVLVCAVVFGTFGILALASSVCMGEKSANCTNASSITNQCTQCLTMVGLPVLQNESRYVCYALTNFVSGMTECGDSGTTCNWKAGGNCSFCNRYAEKTGSGAGQYIYGNCCMGPQ